MCRYFLRAVFIILWNMKCYCCQTSTGRTEFRCPKFCHCLNTQVICHRYIPKVLPVNSTKVVLKCFNEILKENAFEDQSWRNILYLELFEEDDICDESKTYVIHNGTFSNLQSLEHLMLQLDRLENIYVNTFEGLDNVRKLEFINCLRLSSTYVLAAFNNKRNLRKLELLSFNHLNKIRYPPESFDVNETVYNIIARPNLSVLYVNNTRFGNIDLTNISVACKKLKTFSFRRSVIDGLINIGKDNVCDSLETLDLYGFDITNSIFHFDLQNRTFDMTNIIQILQTMFPKLKMILIDELIPKDPPSLLVNSNATAKLSRKLSLNLLSANNNGIKALDVKTNFNPPLCLNAVELMENELELLSPGLFYGIICIQEINFAKNRLSVMAEKNEKIFVSLINMLESVRKLDLSSNGLKKISWKMFQNCSFLKDLYLQDNNLKVVVHPQFILPLKFLNLSNNWINTIDDSGRKWFDLIAKRSPSFHMTLIGNPLVCSCEDMSFVSWFSSSNIFYESRNESICLFHNKPMFMRQPYVKDFVKDCGADARLRIILICSISPIIFVLILSCLVFHTVKRIRKYIANKRVYDENVRLLRETEYTTQIPVLFSYCSDDEKIVRDEILPRMEEVFELLTTRREIVSIVDECLTVGQSILAGMSNSIEQCGVFFVVLSNAFCDDPICKMGLVEAYLKKTPLCILIVEDIDECKRSPEIELILKVTLQFNAKVVDNKLYESPNWLDVCSSLLQIMNH